ncbi:MAG: 50S ribosomal protein L29 [Deltaproteobacteria bacterium]|nr:50S ribosomal protein L29 [Deltaproteobacteria bacterium]
MKKTDFLEEIRRLDPSELLSRKDALEKEALGMRLQIGGASMKNVRGIRELRRNIARVNTVLKEKAAAEAVKAEAARKAGATPGREG